MGVKMEFTMLILCVIPALVTPITVSTNGNSPKTRMVGGMMTNTEEGFVPMTPKVETTTQSNYEKSRTFNTNVTELSINERYRRLIPYMTFYYANDLTNPSTVKSTNVEVEKAEIIEQRQPKKIVYSSQRNIPRYQGNRLTQYNIASANPTKIFYKDGVAYHQNPKVSPNANPFVGDTHEYEFGRFKPKQPVGFRSATRKPFYNLYNEETPNIRYYLSEKEPSLKYKLIPYEQTPPVKVPSYEQPQIKLNPYKHTPSKISPYEQSPSKISPYEQSPSKISPYEQSPSKITPYEQSPSKVSPYEQSPVKTNIYDSLPVDFDYEQTPVKVVPYEQPPPVKMPSYEPLSHAELPQKENNYEPRRPVLVSVLVPKDLYDKPRPVRPPFFYEGASEPVRKQPSIVSESYYEKQPQQLLTEPVVESGFQPIAPPVGYTTEQPIHKTTAAATKVTLYDIEDSDEKHEDKSEVPEHGVKPNYYQYEADQPKSKPPQMMSSPTSLASLLNSLQVNKAVPKPITTNNVGSSIQTLLHFLNNLKAKQNGTPLLSTPKPFLPQNVLVKVPPKPELLVSRRPEVSPAGLQDEHILADVETPSQHLDDHATYGGSSQQFPLPTYSDDDGGTPGRPGVDYPILTIIPPTSFDCKTQRYKGFFADTETRCQVWHYCDLNGGQASFLCPNGTIFSQAGLTCDWWFNVKCSNTPQLYVLNESLYKFILPHSPKFPEDYSGPLVDKYLTLKFKEMEEEFKKNKNKNAADEPKEEEEEEEDDEDNMKKQTEHDKRQLYELSEASVIVESPGTSGKVQRLIDEYK